MFAYLYIKRLVKHNNKQGRMLIFQGFESSSFTSIRLPIEVSINTFEIGKMSANERLFICVTSLLLFIISMPMCLVYSWHVSIIVIYGVIK